MGKENSIGNGNGLLDGKSDRYDLIKSSSAKIIQNIFFQLHVVLKDVLGANIMCNF
jgi:hypothetical protein